jgi:hypothetical protein
MLIQNRTALSILLLGALLLPLTACGGAGDARSLISEGNTQLNSADYAGAVASFDSALAGMTEADGALRKDAVLGKCEALAHVDSAKSKSEFLALADQGGLDYSSYNRVAVALTSASKFPEAIALLTHGMEKFPAEAKFAKLRDKIGDAAKNAGDSAAMEALAGLGYVGN